MRFIIVTGMSGAGKSTVLKTLEDEGYFCVDNLPVLLIKKFADLSQDANFSNDKVAIGIDIHLTARITLVIDVSGSCACRSGSRLSI